MATDQATGRDDPTTRTVYTTRDATEAPAGDAEAAPAHGARADAANGRSRRPDGPTFTGTRTLGQLTSQLIDNLSLLVEKQVELAKQEAMETVRGGLGVLKLFAPALAVALLFVIALINLLIALLALVLPLWASALIFTLLFLIITGVLAYLGYRRLKKMLEHPMGNTIESLREDVEWAQRQLTPGER